jgi:hypothetical protein
MTLIRSPATSGSEHAVTLLGIPEERGSQLHRYESPKPRTYELNIATPEDVLLSVTSRCNTQTDNQRKGEYRHSQKSSYIN